MRFVLNKCGIIISMKAGKIILPTTLVLGAGFLFIFGQAQAHTFNVVTRSCVLRNECPSPGVWTPNPSCSRSPNQDELGSCETKTLAAPHCHLGGGDCNPNIYGLYGAWDECSIDPNDPGNPTGLVCVRLRDGAGGGRGICIDKNIDTSTQSIFVTRKGQCKYPRECLVHKEVPCPDDDLRIVTIAFNGCGALPSEEEATERACGPKPDCSDGRDNDGDGRIDYPDDGGCEGPNDGNETDSPERVCQEVKCPRFDYIAKNICGINRADLWRGTLKFLEEKCPKLRWPWGGPDWPGRIGSFFAGGGRDFPKSNSLPTAPTAPTVRNLLTPLGPCDEPVKPEDIPVTGGCPKPGPGIKYCGFTGGEIDSDQKICRYVREDQDC